MGSPWYYSTGALVAVLVLLRAGFFFFGLYQDATMEVPYTDIDYVVFTDAARYVSAGASPFLRATYRYTPLLAWMMVPTTHVYSFGKVVFMACDLLTGVLIQQVLRMAGTPRKQQAILSSIWLLNPMVITISTRGSSESVLTVMVMALVYFAMRNRPGWCGVFAGLLIHWKLYPVIYLPLLVLYFATSTVWGFVPVPNSRHVWLAAGTALLVAATTLAMYQVYGHEYLHHAVLYHFLRLDHRHNFSVFNQLLYQVLAQERGGWWSVERLAFVPQLLFLAVLVPLRYAKRDLVASLFVQTFVFVAFNKVVTLQYFVWFLIFLPGMLRESQLLGRWQRYGVLALVLWVVAQGVWLFNAYRLEFLGENTFGGLMVSSLFFFAVNVWMTGLFCSDLDLRAASHKH